MAFIETQLHLVNRTLRQSGYHDALEREEATVRTLAAQGLAIEWIAAQIRSSRAVAAYDASTPSSGAPWERIAR